MSRALEQFESLVSEISPSRRPTLSLQAGATLSVPQGSHLTLREVANPFGRADSQNIDLNGRLRNNPEDPIVDELVEQTRADLDTAVRDEVDGVLYRLHGACSQHCSPMQYGGFYLERDRALLGQFASQLPLVLLVVGADETYVDVVSDLPAHVFAWDAQASVIPVREMRAMRAGLLASNDPDGDIDLQLPPAENLIQRYERNQIHV